jgi:tetratricopeptide (TPR) repeat protein
MKKILTIATIILLVISVPAYALFNSDVKKAKEYIQAGMIPQAIELLNKRINDKPTDAEAHFILGKCYLQQGNMSAAAQRFESAIKLDPNNRQKAGSVYKDAGNDRLAKGDLPGGQRLYMGAIQYSPSLKPQIGQACFDRGAGSLNKAYLDMAISIDSAYKMKAYNLIMDKADAASDDACLELYEMAAGYCGKECDRSKAAGERLLSISKSIEANSRSDKRVGNYRNIAGMFIHVPPDYKVYGPGDNPEFALRAGTSTDHYIRFENETHVRIISSLNKGQYEFLPRNGKPVSVYLGEKTPDGLNDYKIRAIKDVVVSYRITKYRP